MDKTKPDRSRRFEMNELELWAQDPRFDDERSKYQFIYPIRIKRSVAKKEGLRLAVGNPANETYRRGPFVCATSPESHLGPFRWAIDFLVPDGTPVITVCDGKIIEIQENSELWGAGPEYRNFLNYVTVQHDNGELTQYCHLAKDSVTRSGVSVGSTVRRGQQIAVVGKTGWTDRDHLHFVVFRNGVSIGPFGFKSLQPTFKRRWWPW